MERLILLASDVDNTLLGDDEALERFAEWYDEARHHVRLAYNSGRFFESVAQSVAETALPQPDAIIGGVGSEIHLAPSAERLADWPTTDGDWDYRAVRAVLTAHKQLVPQPDHLQSEFKVSFYGDDLDAHFLEDLRRQLSDLRHAVEIIYSSDRDLDVLPANTNKGTAVEHLAAHWQIEPANVIVAGDSGNDAPMFGRGFRGIVVGNAKPELKSIDDANVYRASGHCAAGVLEGLQHWLPTERG